MGTEFHMCKMESSLHVVSQPVKVSTLLSCPPKTGEDGKLYVM